MTQSLLTRLEEAEGPDRDLDAHICLAFGWTLQKMKGDSRPYFRRPGETRGFMRADPPRYTASLDASLALARERLPDLRLELLQHGGGWDAMLRPDSFTAGPEATAPTPALAVLIALLKALGHD